ncbi:Histone acetyltransferase mst1 [Elsinoe australis]|uniref:Histone acetyltransferase mst1 n=1 Tax=Elsinoe australis TaxID=40998 RepID=A0A2P7ZY99_9PEZI|nr:Histone acetyltransferase mst1 [Elsinoe australis]
MVGRKFSFNFRETFGAGKSETKGRKGSQGYSDDYSPPPSPHPGRRDPLPARMEVDLRLACAGIVNNTIPSDAYVENPYEDMGRPQLDYTAVRSNSETARQRSMSGSKHTRNFSNPAANSEFPDFPIPGPNDRSKYAYKPDTALKDLFAVPDRTHFTSLADRSRRRAESISSLDKGTAQKAPTGRQASRSFSVASNLPLNSLPVRPKQVRRALSQETDPSAPQTDYSEFHISDPTAPTSATFSSKRAKHASYHGPTRVEQEASAQKEVDRGRQRKSWYKPFANAGEEGQGTRSRSGSRARSITRSIQEYIRPGSTGPNSQSASRQRSRAHSTASRRSSASSGVIPGGKNRFSWKNFRQSWSSWRDSTDLENGSSNRLNKRASGASLRNRKSVNLNRELPPLPSIHQWQGEEDSPTIPQFPIKSPTETSSEKPKHISALWNKAAAKSKSVEFKKPSADQKKEYRKSMGPAEYNRSVESKKKKLEYRKSYSDFNYAHPRIPVSQFESPILPHVMAPMSPPPLPKGSMTFSPKIHRKPVPLSNSTPTDSVMDNQETTVVVPIPIEEIGLAQTTPELTLVIPPAPDVPPPPVPTQESTVLPTPATEQSAATTNFTTAASTVVPTPAAEEPSATPAFITAVSTPTAAPATGTSTPRATPATDAKLKRRSGNYSWLPPEQDYKDMSPISRSASLSAKRRSGNYSWLPPVDTTSTPVSEKRRSWMVSADSTSTPVSEKRRSWLPPADDTVTPVALKRRSWLPPADSTSTSTPVSEKRRSWIPPADDTVTPVAHKRRSWLPPEDTVPTVAEKHRPSALDLQQSTPGAVPKRLLERQEDPATGEVMFIRNDSVDAFNSLQSPRYQYADDIASLASTPPPVPPKDPIKKAKWKFGKKKATTWMDEMEKLGIKDGVLLTDQLNGPPIVRY